MRKWTWAVAGSAVLLAACGGGGGGSSSGAGSAGGTVANTGSGDGSVNQLIVSLSYSNATVNVLQQVTVQPQLGGFEGHAASCSLITGNLPTGMRLGSDCVISGRPLQDGTFPFLVRVGAAGASNTIDVTASLKVQAPLVMYPDRSFLQALALGDSVSDAPKVLNWTQPADVQATWTYSLAGGALPAGLGLDPATGIISGTAQASGSFTATVQSTLGTQFGTFTPVVSTYLLNVGVPFIGFPSNNGTQSVAGYISQPLSVQAVPVGHSAPGSTFSNVTLTGTLPDGLQLSSTGLLSGTPTGTGVAGGHYDVQGTLVNGSSTASTTGILDLGVASPVIYKYNGGGEIDVRAGVPLAIDAVSTQLSPTALLPTATTTFQQRAGGCNLPPGVSLDTTTGQLTGTPTTTGAFSCYVEAVITNNGVTWNAPAQAYIVVQ